jgi:hypothetical protein
MNYYYVVLTATAIASVYKIFPDVKIILHIVIPSKTEYL